MGQSKGVILFQSGFYSGGEGPALEFGSWERPTSRSGPPQSRYCTALVSTFGEPARFPITMIGFPPKKQPRSYASCSKHSGSPDWWRSWMRQGLGKTFPATSSRLRGFCGGGGDGGAPG